MADPSPYAVFTETRQFALDTARRIASDLPGRSNPSSILWSHASWHFWTWPIRIIFRFYDSLFPAPCVFRLFWLSPYCLSLTFRFLVFHLFREFKWCSLLLLLSLVYDSTQQAYFLWHIYEGTIPWPGNGNFVDFSCVIWTPAVFSVTQIILPSLHSPFLWETTNSQKFTVYVFHIIMY